MKIRSIRAALLVVSVICLLASRADADDPRDPPKDPTAYQHFDLGNKLYGMRKFNEAIAEYQQGAMAESVPVFDLALGQCYRQLAQWDKAQWYLDRFVKYGKPTGNTLRGVNKLIDEVQAELQILRERRLHTDVALRVPEQQEMHVKTPTPPPPSPHAMTTIRPWYKDRLGLVLTGAGLVSLGASSYLTISGVHLHNLSNTDPSDTQRDRYASEAKNRYTWAIGLGALGVGLIAAGVVKFTVYPTTSNDSTGVAIAGRY